MISMLKKLFGYDIDFPNEFPVYARALLTAPVLNEEDLKSFWGFPVITRVTSKKVLLLCRFLTYSDNKLVWHASCRIVGPSRQAKERKIWLKDDILFAAEHLDRQFRGVGKIDTKRVYSSKYALHLEYGLTDEETRIFNIKNPSWRKDLE